MTGAFSRAFNGELHDALKQAIDGSRSFFRGLSRYARHESRLFGGYGLGEQVQAAVIEQMLFGEGLELVLKANQELIKAGLDVAQQNSITLAGRQMTGLLVGSFGKGGTAGPSLNLLAGIGDVYFNIESLALNNKIFVTTVDSNRPILPQLNTSTRLRVSRALEDLVGDFLLGE